MDDKDVVEVNVVFLDNGPEGRGWYVWEVGSEDEGYVHFSHLRPTAGELKAVHADYVEVKQ